MKLVAFGLVFALLIFFGCAQQASPAQQQPAPPVSSGGELPPAPPVEQGNVAPPVQPPSGGNTGNGSEAPPAPPSAPTVTAVQLAAHNTEGDCWVAYQGKVYDITAFLPKHKGGDMKIVPLCGTAAEFESTFAAKHGTSKVGVLESQGVLKGNYAG